MATKTEDAIDQATRKERDAVRAAENAPRNAQYLPNLHAARVTLASATRRAVRDQANAWSIRKGYRNNIVRITGTAIHLASVATIRDYLAEHGYTMTGAPTTMRKGVVLCTYAV